MHVRILNWLSCTVSTGSATIRCVVRGSFFVPSLVLLTFFLLQITGMSLKLVTININNSHSAIKHLSLLEFLRRYEIDVAFLQEVGVEHLNLGSGYVVYNNYNFNGTGTAIVVRDTVDFSDVQYHPNGRIISGHIGPLYVINVYAPSGTSKRTERNDFYAHDVPPYLLPNMDHILLGGDFNCVLRPSDQKPGYNYSPTLERLITGLTLRDTCLLTDNSRCDFTYVRADSASRLDRFYVSQNLVSSVRKTDFSPVAFSDHHAYIVHLTVPNVKVETGRGYWHFNTSLLSDTLYCEQLAIKWDYWIRQQRYFPSVSDWWVQYLKPRVASFSRWFSAEKCRDRKNLYNFYFDCLHEAQRKCCTDPSALPILNKYKAKLLTLIRQRFVGVQVRSKEPLLDLNEEPSLFHVLKEIKRGRRKYVRKISDNTGVVHTSQEDIRNVFLEYYKDLYGPPDDTSPLPHGFSSFSCVLSERVGDELQQPFTPAEIFKAVMQGSKGKSPGIDGLPAEWYQKFYPLIGDTLTRLVNDYFCAAPTTPYRAPGVTVLIPKQANPTRVQHYRPITMMNFDYKILARCLNNRLLPYMESLVGPYQYACVGRKKIYHILETIRDTIATYTNSDTDGAILSIDFNQAFDRVNHRYLWDLLVHLGVRPRFVQWIRLLYDAAQTKLKVNGVLTSAFSIKRSVRQGCPLSMTLFNISLSPLLYSIQSRLHGLTVGPCALKVCSYADDVTVFLRDPDDCRHLLLCIEEYVTTSGAHVNEEKTQLLPLRELSAPFYEEYVRVVSKLRILGITFTHTLKETINTNYDLLVPRVCHLLQENKHRNLSLFSRTLFINMYAYARLWYVARVFPIPTEAIKRLTSAGNWFLWHGGVFRVPYPLPCLSKRSGGLGLLHVGCKARAQFVYSSLQHLLTPSGELSAHLLQTLAARMDRALPSDVRRIPTLYYYYRDVVYEYFYTAAVHPPHCAKELYVVFLQTLCFPPHKQSFRHASYHWSQIWRNISASHLLPSAHSTWFRVVNDIIDTAEKRHRLRFGASALCSICGSTDTLVHRLTSCDLVRQTWHSLTRLVGHMCRTIPTAVQPEMVLYPDFTLFPQTRHNSVIWLLANSVEFLLSPRRHRTYVTYADFLEERYRRFEPSRRKALFANYLEITLSVYSFGSFCTPA